MSQAMLGDIGSFALSFVFENSEKSNNKCFSRGKKKRDDNYFALFLRVKVCI